MLEIKRTAIAFDEQELLELERVITDRDEKGAFNFLKKAVYDRIVRAQQGRLKSHLDTGANPVEGFIKGNK
ncbi:hypothetical protein ES705_32934 [subsurface metagenome]